MSDYDVIIAGGGHNALACAAFLGIHGLTVLVAERNAWVGGGAVTEEIVRPGFKHDLFGASHVWCHVNPDFRNVLRPQLEQKYGLKYLWSEGAVNGHPLPEGPGIMIHMDVDETCDSIAQYSAKDARRYREIFDDFEQIREGFVKNFFSPPNPPSYQPAAMERNPQGLRMLRDYNLSGRAFVEENFENKWVRSTILAWSMGPHVKPDQEAMGASFYIMIPAMHTYGQSIPEGGSMELPKALKRMIEDQGGRVMNNATVKEFLVADGECKGFALEDGTEIHAKRAVVTALDPKQTFLRLMNPKHLDSRFIQSCENFIFDDMGICRVHLALNEAPDYKHGGDFNKVAFHRIFPTVQEIVNHVAEVDQRKLPTNPFIHALNWTRKDPTRAPPGKHTLTIDTYPPTKLGDGVKWEDVKDEFGLRQLEVLRRHTTNMDDSNIIDYVVHTPEDLYRYNRSFHEGAPTGGKRISAQLGAFRPLPGYSQYKSPIPKLYMAGPSCHPGSGISAMGTITARVILKDLKLIGDEDEDFL